MGTIKIEDWRIIIKTSDGKTEVWEKSKQESIIFIICKGIRYIPLSE